MKILVADKISASAVTYLKEKFEVKEQHYSEGELYSNINQFDAIIVRSATKITKDVIKNGTTLKVIGRAGVGVDNIDVDAATEAKIPVVYSPQASSITVAEMTFTFMLALSRNLVAANEKTKQGVWPKSEFQGQELAEKTVGFVGCGRIGAEVVKRALAFGMKCLVYDPYLPQETIRTMGATPVDTLLELLPNADFITIHALLTNETRGMISHREIQQMKSTSYLINCARGGIIDEDALYTELIKNTIAGAALDVFATEPAILNPLFKLSNVYVTPHIGAMTKEAQKRAGQTTAEQVERVLRGEKPKFCVNPDVLNLEGMLQRKR